MLRPDGEIHIADWGLSDTTALRAGFPLTQLLDGLRHERPPAGPVARLRSRGRSSCPLPRSRTPTSPPLLAVFG